MNVSNTYYGFPVNLSSFNSTKSWEHAVGKHVFEKKEDQINKFYVEVMFWEKEQHTCDFYFGLVPNDNKANYLDEAGNSDNLKGFYFFPKNKTAYYKPDGEIEKFGQKVGCRQKLGFLLDMDEGELTFYLDGKPMEKPNMIKHDRLKTEKFNMNCIASYDISSYSNYWILEKPPACHYHIFEIKIVLFCLNNIN